MVTPLSMTVPKKQPKPLEKVCFMTMTQDTQDIRDSCIREHCGIWDSNQGCCAVLAISMNLACLHDAVVDRNVAEGV